jgi:Cd2+/Zn2+-exporting ATPase
MYITMSQAIATGATVVTVAQPLRVKIAGMDCGSCAITIENSMRQLPGVSSVEVSFTTEIMELKGEATLPQIEQRLRELGYRVAGNDGPVGAPPAPPTELHGAAGFFRFLWEQQRLRVALLVTAAVFAGIPLLANAPPVAGLAPLDALFILAVLVAGTPVFIKGFRALFFARRITIDLLMAIASVGALGIGETGEAVTVILLYTLGEALEAYSAEKARNSLRSLMSLQPQEATVLREHRGGHDEPATAGGTDAHAGCDHEGHDHGHGDADHGHAGHDHAAHDHAAHDDHADCGHDHHDHDHGHGHGHAHAAAQRVAAPAATASCGHDHDHGHAHTHEAKKAHDHDDHAGCSHDDHHGHDHGKHAGHAHAPAKQAAAPAPTRAAHADDDVHYHQLVVPVERVEVGETVLVRPGQRIPVDGAVLRGQSSVNQAAVTGESDPVPRGPGDEVMAGTVNGEAALEIRVTRPAGDATIARIARLVEQAQSQRSPAERFIDRFARWYTPAVVALAAIMVAVPVLVFGQPLLDSADGTHGWLYRALALLIVACPCALVISIPVTVVSSLTRLANLGVLVKGGAQLDRLADVRAVAFDKTGTLTHGRPLVTAVRASDCGHPDDVAANCDDCDDVVALAASVERASEHPLAHAIVTAATGRQLQHRYQLAGTVTAHAGRGVSGQLGNGIRVAVGSDTMFAGSAANDGPFGSRAVSVRDAGQTVMYVARNDEVVGFIGVQDEVREASRAALRELHEADPPVAAVMLTGDNPKVAARVAQQLGYIDDVRAGLLPEQKLAAIEDLHRRHGNVAMVGDGINDAPALARADVGIAMGAGTAQAMETADVVLMQDDISHVPMALRVARKSRTLVKQNIVLSLGLKVVFLALAVPGITTLWMAVLADVGATMLVTLNGMRVLRQK